MCLQQQCQHCQSPPNQDGVLLGLVDWRFCVAGLSQLLFNYYSN
jgi:hypothetical protein